MRRSRPVPSLPAGMTWRRMPSGESLAHFSTFDVAHRRDLRALRIEDLGDLSLRRLDAQHARKLLVERLQEARPGTDAVIVLGGNNSVTRPCCLAMEPNLKRCGLLTLDAHLDLRRLDRGLNNGNHVRALLRDGLPGENIVEVGIQSFANSKPYFSVAQDAGITVVPLEEVCDRGIKQVIVRAFDMLAERVDSIAVDVDLDVLDRAHAPGTAGARPGGLTPLQLRQAAYQCGLQRKVRTLDLVELDPTKDSDGVTSLSAAVCLLSFASGVLGRREST